MVGYNMYAYCSNNPVICVDYSGHMWQFAPGMHPENHVFGGKKSSFYPESTAYSSYRTRCRVAEYDASLGGYYNDWMSPMGKGYVIEVVSEAAYAEDHQAGLYTSLKYGNNTYVGTQKPDVAIKKLGIQYGTYIKVDNRGGIYSYAIVSNGQQMMRMDFQGTAHQGVLPHVHFYHYSSRGPDGEIIYNIDGNIIERRGKFK